MGNIYKFILTPRAPHITCLSISVYIMSAIGFGIEKDLYHITVMIIDLDVDFMKEKSRILLISMILMLLISIIGAAQFVGEVTFGNGNDDNQGREESKAQGYTESTCTLVSNDCSGKGPAPSGRVFFDNFDSGRQKSEWDLDDGWSVVDSEGNSVLKGLGHSGAVLKNHEISDFAFKAKFKRNRGGIHFSFRSKGLPDGLHRYFVGIDGETLILTKQLGQGNFDDVLRTDLKLKYADWHWIEIRAKGDKIKRCCGHTLVVN